MERAQALEFPSSFLQLHARADELRDIHAVIQIVNETVRDAPHGSLRETPQGVGEHSTNRLMRREAIRLAEMERVSCRGAL